jgi:hypothetical protein
MYSSLKVCSNMYDSSDEKLCIEGVSLRPLIAAPDAPGIVCKSSG